MAANRLYGCSDTPLSGKQKNMLGTEKYITGLENFIKGCCTPMSIALQGDWGTGKTSFINTMIDHFEEQGDVVPIYFNTWQYSQFNMSEDLYTSFIISIMSRLKEVNRINSDSAKKAFQNLSGIAVGVGKQFLEKKFDVNLDEVEALFFKEAEKTARVAGLKNDFANLIHESAKNGRIVIFVDDLDRLNPEVAVELLEVMKLFMDVENCVFVLAIDYEVVVKGIRSKYGADMSDAKCRSFFDKIIQLPFRMPVESYTLVNLIKDNVGEKLQGYEEIVADVIKATLGSNPRTFKRLFNAYELLNLVSESKMKEHETAFLLISLILQMQSSTAYKLLLEQSEDKEMLEAFKHSYPDSETIKAEDKACLEEIFNGIDSVGDVACKKERNFDVTKTFINVLGLSSITSVNPAGSVKSASTKANCIEVFGDRIAVSNPTEAMVRSLEILFSRNPEKVEKILEKFPKVLSADESITSGMFYTNKSLKIEGREKPVILATKTGFALKCRQITQICTELQVPSGSVVWYDEKTVVFKY